jgi:hypothetical protein
MHVDVASLVALTASTAAQVPILRDFLQRERRRNVKITIRKDGKEFEIDAKALEKPEEAELFLQDVLSRYESVQGED